MNPLPIDLVLPELIEVLRSEQNAVLQAPTGAGKTTRLPPALLDAGLGGDQLIVMLEPRRLAARAAAYRMAEERGTAVGKEVGYQVRFERKWDSSTRILVVTEGVLVRMLQQDPFLERVSVVIFDEFHERSLDTDLALAMCRRVQQTVRPDLRILVMSATLQTEAVANYLGVSRSLRSEGRLFPVQLQYLEHATTRSSLEPMIQGVSQLLRQTSGDLLVFLPGRGEIHRGLKELQRLADTENISVYGLSGEMSIEDQHAILGTSDRRKIILATNVAETSVTVPGVTGVVDSGLARVMRQDPATGLNQLHLERISQASADQRTGRAGRTAPGVCLRLWTEREQRGMIPDSLPEIRRVDLAGVILELLCWGETDLEQFPWFDPPSVESIQQGLSVLELLGAVHQGELTALGREMVMLPLHPRLGRLVIEGRRWGHLEIVAWGAALLSERNPFVRERGLPHAQPAITSESDVWERIQAIREFLKNRQRETVLGVLNPAVAYRIEQTQQQLIRMVRALSVEEDKKSEGAVPKISSEETLMRALFSAFPDRLARRREPRGNKALMVGGKGIQIDRLSLVHDPELFVCVELDAGQGEAWGRVLSAVRSDWLPKHRLFEKTVRKFDPQLQRVTASRELRYLDLVLEERPVAVPPDAETATILFEHAVKDLSKALPLDDPQLGQFMARVNSLRQWMPDLGLPLIDDKYWHETLPDFTVGCRSFQELRQKPLLEWIKGRFSYSTLQILDREAPERLVVPSGSSITLHYETGRPPVLAVRIQEMFGLQETPRIAGGRVTLLLHLLAPNYRPQQVTDDLQSFWNTTYQLVRKELRARYPKHSWPEDPWTAQPQKRPQRKPSK